MWIMEIQGSQDSETNVMSKNWQSKRKIHAAGCMSGKASRNYHD
jgi:hypothetical protein